MTVLKFSLTHYGLVTPYDDIDLGEHCFRLWFVTWQNKAKPESMYTYHVYSGIHLERISQKCVKITPWKFLHKNVWRLHLEDYTLKITTTSYLNDMHWLIQFGFIVTFDYGIQGTNISITLMHLTYTCNTIIYFSICSRLRSIVDHSWHFTTKPIW